MSLKLDWILKNKTIIKKHVRRKLFEMLDECELNFDN